jgi:hypothetical protein
MNTLLQKNEDTSLTSESAITEIESKTESEIESTKAEIKQTAMKVKTPLMRYFDLIDDASPSYILGYN